jgi:transposase InsO family protein
MKDLYAIAGLTRQGFWKHQQREKQRAEKVRRVLALLHEVRSSGHSRMGCRTAYWKVRDRSPVGRDLFERIGLGHGFRLKRWRNKRKTTIGQTDEVCPNRVEGLKIKRMDQVWQSDICYVPFKGKHLYVVTIIDVYSRRLLALHAGRTLEAKETAKALKMAIRARGGHVPKGCIFHSDRGTQYISQELKKVLNKHGFKRSMAKLPQENAYAERVQGTIKHQYLRDIPIDPCKPQAALNRAMRLYNGGKPHKSLGKLTPIEFEGMITRTPKNRRPVLLAYTWNHGFPQNQHSPQKEKRSKKEKV